MNTTLKEQERKDRFELWSKTGMLKGITSDYDAQSIAVLLDSQRQANEVANDNSQFKRCSIPLVRRVYPVLVASRIASLQPMISPGCSLYYEDKYNNVQRGEVAAKGRKFQTHWSPEDDAALGESHSLDAEAAYCAQIAELLAYEIDREVFADLNKVAKLNLEYIWKDRDHFCDWLRIAGTKVYRGANWLVCGPDMEQELSELEDFSEWEESSYQIRRSGTLFGTWSVFVDDEFLENTVLFGHRGDRPYDAGYAYCPYIPFTLLGEADLGFASRPGGVFTRYGKKLINADYYGKITVVGHSIEEKEDGEEGRNDTPDNGELDVEGDNNG